MRLSRRRQVGRHAAGSTVEEPEEGARDGQRDRVVRVAALTALADACLVAGLRVQWRALGDGPTRYLRVSVVGATVGVRVDFMDDEWSYVWHDGDDEPRSIGPLDDLSGVVTIVHYVLHKRAR
ncbi:hypothetical protein AB0L06_09815 [Spirillospora sp. NPDC052269]